MDDGPNRQFCRSIPRPIPLLDRISAARTYTTVVTAVLAFWSLASGCIERTSPVSDPTPSRCGTHATALTTCPTGQVCTTNGTCAPIERDCDSSTCATGPASLLVGYAGDLEAWNWEPAPQSFYHPAGNPRADVRRNGWAWLTVDRQLAVSTTETTRGAWRTLMERLPETFAACGDSCPVSDVSVAEILTYANRRSVADGLAPCYALEGCAPDATGRLQCASAALAGPACTGWRLPSEPEWELLAKAGTDGCLANGNLDVVERSTCWDVFAAQTAWYCGSSQVSWDGCDDCGYDWGFDCCGPHPVGKLPPNPYGLLDVHGNVWELTGSRWDDPWIAAKDPGHDPNPLAAGPDLVAKGGSYFSRSVALCASMRLRLGDLRPQEVGFRLVRTLPPR